MIFEILYNFLNNLVKIYPFFGIIFSIILILVFYDIGELFFKFKSLKSIFISISDLNYLKIFFGINIFLLFIFPIIIYEFYSKFILSFFAVLVFAIGLFGAFKKIIILKKEKFSLNYKFSSDFNFFLRCFINKTKFFKSDIIICKVKAGGVSDKLRQDVFNENIDIIKKNTKTKHFYKLYYSKINQYLKDIFKFLLPKKSIFFFLKLKHYKRLVENK